jgi:hypothetical protein
MADYPPLSGKTPTSGRPYSGTSESGDPTNEPGQYPPSGQNNIFGGPLPTGTGAPGTSGASGSADPTNEPGQTMDGLTGISETQITSSGAPGSQGATDNPGGPDSVTYTYPNDGIGPYMPATKSDALEGPQDSTQANDSGYATGGPQLPGIRGNEPQAGSARYQPGGGRVLRGGRDVRP